MLSTRLPSAAAALAVLTSVAAAGTLYVGPPGTAPYAEIQAAIDAAAPGDTILVLKGVYQPILVDKPLSIVGYTNDFGKPYVGPATGTPTQTQVTVENLAAGEEVLISGLNVAPVGSSSGSSILVTNNAGTVVLHDIRSYSTRIVSCAYVVLSESTFSSTVTAEDSALWIVSSTIVPPTVYYEGLDGLVLVDSAAYLTRTSVWGGNGQCSIFPQPTPGPGGDAIDATRSLVAVSGGSGVLLAPGVEEYCPFYIPPPLPPPPAAMRLSQGSAGVVSSYAKFFGSIVTDATSFSLQPMIFYPTLGADEVAVSPGESFFLQIQGYPNSLAAIFAASDFGPPFTIPGINGVFVLDPATVQLSSIKTVLSDGTNGQFVQIPATPGLVGSVLVFQWLELSDQPLFYGVSNPAMVSIVP